MNLFAPERPEASPGRKALLRDGSAVPQLSVFPGDVADTVVVSVMVRDYISGELYSYTQKQISFGTNFLPSFVREYAYDPEMALEAYFGWRAQTPTAAKVRVSEEKATVRREVQQYIDDLL